MLDPVPDSPCPILILICILIFTVISVTYFNYNYDNNFKTICYDIKQYHLKKKVVFADVTNTNQIKLVGGFDISFVKGDNEKACLALVVLDLNTLQLVYQDVRMVRMSVEYIPGYLAFRETPHICAALARLKSSQPQWYPDVLIVDGNGRLHKKQFGMACQTGVECDIPCIGVAKNLYQMEGLLRDDNHKELICRLRNKGDKFEVSDVEGVVLGYAVKTAENATKPVYVSQGNKVSLTTAYEIVMRCSLYRNPEPVRQADMLSRDFIRRLQAGGSL